MMTKKSRSKEIMKASLVYLLIIALACGMALCYQIFMASRQ